MANYYAEIGPDQMVLRVVVADDPAWLTATLGGTWRQTVIEDPAEQYAGRLMHDGGTIAPMRFTHAWRQPTGSEDAYEAGAWVWHLGHCWLSLTAANVWEPGVSGWRDYTTEWPEWIQPTGAHDAYLKGEKVTFQGLKFYSLIDANVWDPVTYPPGWSRQDIIIPDSTK